MLRFTLTAIVVACLVSNTCGAEPIEKFYYVGEIKLSSPTGRPMGSQAFLIEKTHDPDNNAIIERAVVVAADGTVGDYIMDMKVSGTAFSLSDRKGTAKGTGELFGPAWHWTYFKADYRSSNGVRITDENFMTDPSMITARKQVSAPDGKPIMYMEGSFKSITPQTFQLLSSALFGKAEHQPTSKASH